MSDSRIVKVLYVYGDALTSGMQKAACKRCEVGIIASLTDFDPGKSLKIWGWSRESYPSQNSGSIGETSRYHDMRELGYDGSLKEKVGEGVWGIMPLRSESRPFFV